MNKYVENKNEYYKHNEAIVRRRKLFWTIILSIVFILFEYLTIFHGTRIRPYSVFTMLGSWAIVIVLYFLWTNIDQLVYSSGKLQKLKYLLIGSFKLSLILVPIIYLTIKSVDYVQDYQLKKYGVLTKGLITNVITIINNESNEQTFHSEYIFLVGNKIEVGFSVINENTYQIGDSVLVLYSSQDENLQILSGKLKSNKLN